MFLKSGEQYVTTDPSWLLPNRKDRSRLIFPPHADTFGLLCPLNNLIQTALASVIPGYCYGWNVERYAQEFSRHNDVAIDLDASNNDALQHAGLKSVIVDEVLRALWP